MRFDLSLCGPRCAAPAPIDMRDARARNDPTRTYYVRARMRAEGDRRWKTLSRTLRQALIEHDLVGMRGIGRLPHGDKTEGFAAWLREELRTKVFGGNGDWVKPYVRQAGRIAQTHVAQHGVGGRVDQDRVSSMETLAASELRGIVEAAQQQITRSATHAIMANATPTQMANALSAVINTMRNRTRAMSEYVIAKTHATATLSGYKAAGVTRVGIIPERIKLGPLRLTQDRRKTAEPEEPDDLLTIRDPLKMLIRRARKYWHSRFAKAVARHGAAKAWATMEAALHKEEQALAARREQFRAALREKGDVFIARREAEGEAVRAAQQYLREDLYRKFAQVSGFAPGETKPPRELPARRAEAPSPNTIGRIETAQARLEATPGGEDGSLVDVLTADDPCPDCEEIADDGPYTLDEAEGLIPAHPFCRCGFAPAEKDQKDARPLADAWSEEARAAALEARRANAHYEEKKREWLKKAYGRLARAEKYAKAHRGGGKFHKYGLKVGGKYAAEPGGYSLGGSDAIQGKPLKMPANLDAAAWQALAQELAKALAEYAAGDPQAIDSFSKPRDKQAMPIVSGSDAGRPFGTAAEPSDAVQGKPNPERD